ANAELSALIHERHHTRGIDIRVDATPTAVRELPDGRLAVDTETGDTMAADLIVVGAGVAPDDRLAREAGLAVSGGHLVRRAWPTQRSGHFRGRRLRALSRTARTDTAGELAACPGARRDRGTQRRRRQCRL